MPLVFIVALAGGCGGGDGDGERLSRAEFVRQADAICRRYESRLDALGQPANLAQLRSFADKALPIAREGREELGELNPPEDLEQTYEDWLDQGDEAIDIVDRLRDAAGEGDQAKIQRIAQEAQETDRESNRLAAELGFQQCGEAGAPSSP